MSSRTRRASPVRHTSSIPAGWPMLLLIVVGAGIYWNSLRVPFMWDDQTAIVTNATIQHLWPLTDPLTPPRETPVAGRPIANLSFAINYAIGGLSERGYHAWNIAVHIACALLLFGLIRRTLEKGSRTRPLFTALGATLLWIVHPLHSETVDYVTQRTESMMALFLLLTLYCAVRARRSEHARGWQALSVFACAVGMATKESMVTAPILVVLYDRIFEFDSLRAAFKSRRSLYLGLAATWIELVALLWQQPRSTAGLSAAVSPWVYLLNQTHMINRYLRLTVWPAALVLDYGLLRSVSMREAWPDALVILLLLVATGLTLVRWPKIGFLAATFFITLAPTSSLIPISSEVGAERRMYLPLAALVLLAAIGVRALVDRAGHDPARRRLVPLAVVGLATAILIALATRTVTRNAEYATPLSVWRTVVERWPHGRARLALASELIAAGQHDEAVSQLRAAVRDYPDARYELGTELVAGGNVEEGIGQLRLFIQDKPSYPNRIPARALLGQALASQGKLAESADEFRAILTATPSHDGVRASLADVLVAQGRYDEAAGEYMTVLATRPDSSTIETKLAIDLLRSGRLSDARDHFRKALQIDPQSATLNRYLAEVSLRQNDAPHGEAYAREALRLDPRDPIAHNLLGVAAASNGRIDEAIAHFKQALQIDPNDPQAQANLDRALGAKSTQHH